MRMAAMGLRRLRRTAPLSTASIKRTRMDPPHRHTLRMAPRLMARRVNTATAPQLARPPVATSMLRRTEMFTKTPEAVGSKPRARVLLRLTAMDSRKRVAGRPLLAAEAEDGSPGQRALVAQRAVAVSTVDERN